ncbi:hypothetical protein D3OALGA1CA_5034 [Olavius algarvensis associated proteobacterium Delta 3]|nr:hypothetical protein D3OALGA1CA_5034 [Olavius algarvensis associated proteobacterium Delta 3]
MGMTKVQKEWFESLLSAHQKIAPVASLESTCGAITVDEAYAVQRMMIEERCKAGERIVGWKVGATSQAVMEQLGINEPVYGRMTSSSLHSPDVPAKVSDFCRMAIEGEIAFVMGRDLRGPGISPADVLTATAGIMGAVELVDCRINGWKPTVAEIIADNALHAGVILGPIQVPAAGLDLQGEGVALKKNGRLLARAHGTEALGNPSHVVTWLVNTLANFGHEIRGGDIILTGSLTKYFFVSPGDTVDVSFSNLGEIHFIVA